MDGSHVDPVALISVDVKYDASRFDWCLHGIPFFSLFHHQSVILSYAGLPLVILSFFTSLSLRHSYGCAVFLSIFCSILSPHLLSHFIFSSRNVEALMTPFSVYAIFCCLLLSRTSTGLSLTLIRHQRRDL